MNIKMIELILVRDHMVRMIGIFNEMEIIGVEIDGKV